LLDFYVHIIGTLSYLINELLTLFGSQGFESMLMTFLGFWKVVGIIQEIFTCHEFPC